MEKQEGELYFLLDQMFGCTMGQDSADEFDGPLEAATHWVMQDIGLVSSRRMLEEIDHLNSTTKTALERRQLFLRDIIFLQDDGSDLDPLLAQVELMLRERLASGS